jgi:hypothetical protein
LLGLISGSFLTGTGRPVSAQTSGRPIVLAEASGDIENKGFRCRAVLTRQPEFGRVGNQRMEAPEGKVWLRIFRPRAGKSEQELSLFVGEGATGKLLVQDLTGDGDVEVFVFVNGQATSTHVFRFSGKSFVRLLSLQQGRPQVECRRRTDGKWAIIEHGLLDWYDGVPDAVARQAKRWAKPQGMPSVARIHLWNHKRKRFEVRAIVAEKPRAGKS